VLAAIICGIPFISSTRSGRFASKVATPTTTYSSMWQPSIGTTSTSPAITPAGKTYESRKAVSAPQKPDRSLAYFISPFVKRSYQGNASDSIPQGSQIFIVECQYPDILIKLDRFRRRSLASSMRPVTLA
jgi:hypothetical protein